MSYNSNGIFTAGICTERLLDLADIKGNMNDPLMKRSPLGYLESITSPLNTNGRVSISVQDGEKYKTARIKWRQRAIASQVTSSKSGTCSTDNYKDFEEETITLSKAVEYKFGINTYQSKLICEGRLDFMRSEIFSAFDALARDINASLLTEQALNFGKNIRTGATTASDLTVFPAATGNPNARPLQILKNDFRVKNQFNGTMMLIGAGNAYDYWTTLESACCNDGGVDMLALSNSLGWSPFIDTQMEDYFGTNHFMTMEPGSVQLITFNDYVGIDATSAGSEVSRTTIVDPRTGIRYDLKVMQDGCSDNYVVIINLTYDVWFTPISQFQFDDPLHGTRGTLRYRAVTS